MVIQTSPVFQAQSHLQPVMGVFHATEVALEFGSGVAQAERAAKLGVADLSCFPRLGVKGTGAAEWLASLGVTLPSAPNQWVIHEDTLVLRLGNSEYLLEDQAEEALVAGLQQQSPQMNATCYPVARNDAALIISGSEVFDLMREVCALDINAELADGQRLLMTQLAGISVTLLKQNLPAGDVIRIWCDGTYGNYLWHTLVEIAEELGGGPVGLSYHFNMKY